MLGRHAHAHGAALGREFDRVADQVQDDLLDARRVELAFHGALRQLGHQRQPGRRRLGLQALERLDHHRREVRPARLHAERAGLHLGVVEQVVHQALKPLGARADVVDEFLLDRRERAADLVVQELAEPHDARQRRAQLMRDGVQELPLELVELAELGHGRGQLLVVAHQLIEKPHVLPAQPEHLGQVREQVPVRRVVGQLGLAASQHERAEALSGRRHRHEQHAIAAPRQLDGPERPGLAQRAVRRVQKGRIGQVRGRQPLHVSLAQAGRALVLQDDQKRRVQRAFDGGPETREQVVEPDLRTGLGREPGRDRLEIVGRPEEPALQHAPARLHRGHARQADHQRRESARQPRPVAAEVPDGVEHRAIERRQGGQGGRVHRCALDQDVNFEEAVAQDGERDRQREARQRRLGRDDQRHRELLGAAEQRRHQIQRQAGCKRQERPGEHEAPLPARVQRRPPPGGVGHADGEGGEADEQPHPPAQEEPVGVRAAARGAPRGHAQGVVRDGLNARHDERRHPGRGQEPGAPPDPGPGLREDHREPNQRRAHQVHGGLVEAAEAMRQGEVDPQRLERQANQQRQHQVRLGRRVRRPQPEPGHADQHVQKPDQEHRAEPRRRVAPRQRLGGRDDRFDPPLAPDLVADGRAGGGGRDDRLELGHPRQWPAVGRQDVVVGLQPGARAAPGRVGLRGDREALLTPEAGERLADLANDVRHHQSPHHESGHSHGPQGGLPISGKRIV
ncbi:hypothetical protein D3C72_815170 [compost metagenome]